MEKTIKSLISSITSHFNGKIPIPHGRLIHSHSTANPLKNPNNDLKNFTDKDLESEEILKALFERWLSYHDLESKYRHEKAKRFNLFKDNVRYVHEHNKQDCGYTRNKSFLSNDKRGVVTPLLAPSPNGQIKD